MRSFEIELLNEGVEAVLLLQGRVSFARKGCGPNPNSRRSTSAWPIAAHVAESRRSLRQTALASCAFFRRHCGVAHLINLAVRETGGAFAQCIVCREGVFCRQADLNELAYRFDPRRRIVLTGPVVDPVDEVDGDPNSCRWLFCASRPWLFAPEFARFCHGDVSHKVCASSRLVLRLIPWDPRSIAALGHSRPWANRNCQRRLRQPPNRHRHHVQGQYPHGSTQRYSFRVCPSGCWRFAGHGIAALA
jgi:hypothetical protein